MHKLLIVLFAAILALTSANAQTKIIYGSNPKAGHYVLVNGIELYYEVYGS